jgi:hypothetical protein
MYINAILEGTPVAHLAADAAARLYARHSDQGTVGTMNVGMLPRGRSLLYTQAHFPEDCGLEILQPGGERRPLISAESAELLAAFQLLERRFARSVV